MSFSTLQIPSNIISTQTNIRKWFVSKIGITVEINNGKLFITCWNKEYDQTVHFIGNTDQVSLISQTHHYLQCAEESRVPWCDSEGFLESIILQFDSERRPTGYIITKPKSAIKYKGSTILTNFALQNHTYPRHSSIITN